MASIINASPTNGIVQTADGSGVLKIQSNSVTTNALAWVNFNGTGTVAIRSSYNVSSITDNGTGSYTLNFATALSDANYATAASAGSGGNAAGIVLCNYTTVQSTTAVNLLVLNSAVSAVADYTYVSVTIHGN